jgi:sigma-B regulation protein RsbQ
MNIYKRHNINTSGNGEQTLIFSAGFGCEQSVWRFVAPAFSSFYRLLMFDHAGAGQSDLAAYDSKRHSTLLAYAQDLLELLRELQLTNVVFVGHSVSAMIGLLAANQEPERFAKLVLVGSSPRYINDETYFGGFDAAEVNDLLSFLESDFAGWTGTIAPNALGNLDRPELTEELITSFTNLDTAVARQFARVTFTSDNRPDLAKLRVPSLIVQSKEDFLVPNVVADYLHEHLPGSSLSTVNTSGHYPHLTAPVATISAIDQFLQASK